MKRPRPRIPLKVRLVVARRQCVAARGERNTDYLLAVCRRERYGLEQTIANLLSLAGFDDFELDHDPALILRQFNERTGKYTPDANDPAYLVYRTPAQHLKKTTGRTPGAAKTVDARDSDMWLKRKFDRLEGRTKRRPKQKIPSRPFPKAKRKSRHARPRLKTRR